MFAFCESEFLWIKTEQRSLCVGQHDKFSDRSEPGFLFEIKGKIRKCLNGISAVPHTEFAWKPVLVWNVANNHGLRCKRSASRWHCSKWPQWPFDSLGGSDVSCFTCGCLVDQHPPWVFLSHDASMGRFLYIYLHENIENHKNSPFIDR